MKPILLNGDPDRTSEAPLGQKPRRELFISLNQTRFRLSQPVSNCILIAARAATHHGNLCHLT